MEMAGGYWLVYFVVYKSNCQIGLISRTVFFLGLGSSLRAAWLKYIHLSDGEFSKSSCKNP